MSFFNNHKVMVIRATTALIGTLVLAWLLSVFTSFSFVMSLAIIVTILAVVVAATMFARRPRPKVAKASKPAVSSNRNYRPILVAVIIAGVLLVGALALRSALLSSSLPASVASAGASVLKFVAIGVAIVVLFSGIQTTREIRKRQPNRGQTHIQISTDVELVSVSSSTIDKLRHVLVPTDQYVQIATRKHPANPLLQTLAPVQVRTVDIPGSDKKRKKIYRNWWPLLGICLLIPVLPLLVDQVTAHSPAVARLTPLAYLIITFFWVGVILQTALRFAVNWVQWYSWYFIATEARVQVVVMWPAWLFWIDGRQPDMVLSRIQWCEALDQDNWLSKLFKKSWGAVDIDGISDHDGDFNVMTDLPYSTKLRMKVLSLMQQAKEGQTATA